MDRIDSGRAISHTWYIKLKRSQARLESTPTSNSQPPIGRLGLSWELGVGLGSSLGQASVHRQPAEHEPTARTGTDLPYLTGSASRPLDGQPELIALLL